MPKAIKGNFNVCRDTRSVRVFAWRHPKTGKRAWRFSVPDPEAKGGWRYVTRATQALATAAAEEWLDQQPSGFVWMTLPAERRRFLEAIHRDCGEGDQEALLAFLASRKRSAEVVASVARYLAHQITEAGEESPHLVRVRGVLEGFAAAHAGRMVSDIHKPDLEAWWDARCAKVGKKRKADIRSVLVSFWTWARKENLAGNDAYSPAQRLAAPRADKMEIRIASPRELLLLAKHADLLDRPAIVLGAFCGMRPEECAPPTGEKATRKDKRGLVGEDIDWTFKVIRVPREVSKVNRSRIVPLSECALAWLEWAGIGEESKGPLCARNMVQAGETARLGKLVFGGRWPKDVLRHTYASMRNSTLRNLEALAEEMGTSKRMLDGHYHNPRAEAEGVEWFAQRPLDMIRYTAARDPMRSDGNGFPASEGCGARGARS